MPSEIPDRVANLNVVVDRAPEGMLEPRPGVGKVRKSIAFLWRWSGASEDKVVQGGVVTSLEP